MFKKTITFENFNGETETKDFYFHMSKADLLSMAGDGSSMQKRLEAIQKTQDVAAVLVELRALISAAVGVRSEDGKRFIKDDDAKSNLLDSPAYDELLFELVSNPDQAANFFAEMLPEKMKQEIKEIEAKAEKTVSLPENDLPLYQKENRAPTQKEFQAMSQQEMMRAWAFKEQLNK